MEQGLKSVTESGEQLHSSPPRVMRDDADYTAPMLPIQGSATPPPVGSPARLRGQGDMSPTAAAQAVTSSPRRGTASPRLGAQTSRAWLVSKAAPNRRLPVVCEEGVLFSIGRAAGCSLQVTAGAEIGGVHCCIRYCTEPAPHCTIFDLASRAGLVVNGVRVAGHTTLKHGDSIALQQVDPHLQFTYHEKPSLCGRASPPREALAEASVPAVRPSYDQSWRKEPALVYRPMRGPRPSPARPSVEARVTSRSDGAAAPATAPRRSGGSSSRRTRTSQTLAPRSRSRPSTGRHGRGLLSRAPLL
eukprot:TRINITY_DN8865_c1_g1_i1.p1 TRINITY_DN8865_c1_g1~~TRINITY_DN8865_c1_g1_i1.p1  ORF type:complete len:302 (+),score=50.85 TRINITY_DN8865_c1_g1_i1:138-1043(+)